jgi:hypothetical protein
MDFLNKKIIAAIHELRDEVTALRKSIDFKSNQDERHYQEENDRRKLQQAPIRVEAEVHEKPDPAGKKKPSSAGQITVQWVTAIATIAASIAPRSMPE